MHAQTFKVQGLVVEVDRAQGLVVVSHRPIPGYMPAMVMPFRAAAPRELDGLTPGARITFDLHVDQRRKTSTVRNIRPETSAAADGDFKIPVPPNQLRVGDPVPDFALTDQDGRTVRLSEFRNRTAVAINFVYTRCPLPDVCPRLAASFAYVHRNVGSRVQLLTITVDPTHDTPPVLKDYAKRWNADGDHWRFLTSTSEAAIQQAGGLFGVVFWPEEGAITHTSATAVIGADGQLKALVSGSAYRAGQLKDLIEKHLR